MNEWKSLYKEEKAKNAITGYKRMISLPMAGNKKINMYNMMFKTYI